MRHPIPAALVIGILLALCFTAACTMPFLSQDKKPQQEIKTPVNLGSAQINIPGNGPYTGLDEALQNMVLWEAESDTNREFHKSIYYIRGENLDASGRASQWYFGVQEGNNTILLAYNGNQWKIISMERKFSSKKINTDQIVLPSAIINQSRSVITRVSGPSSRQYLDISGDVFTLTITSPQSEREFQFNASTGAMIS